MLELVVTWINGVSGKIKYGNKVARNDFLILLQNNSRENHWRDFQWESWSLLWESWGISLDVFYYVNYSLVPSVPWDISSLVFPSVWLGVEKVTSGWIEEGLGGGRWWEMGDRSEHLASERKFTSNAENPPIEKPRRFDSGNTSFPPLSGTLLCYLLNLCISSWWSSNTNFLSTFLEYQWLSCTLLYNSHTFIYRFFSTIHQESNT